MSDYDSRPDTYEHIAEVRRLMIAVGVELISRGHVHDRSKLESPEREAFDRLTEQLRGLTYGSPEYKAALEELGPALTHHYAANRHHPEHWPDGIKDMSLLDVVEMLCDWLAATKRHEDGDVQRSIELNRDRFEYGDELARLLTNTLPFLENT